MTRGLSIVVPTAVLLACLIGRGSAVPPHPDPVYAASSPDNPEGDECRECHTAEVDGYQRTRMAHSMRVAAHEPAGVVHTPEATIRMDSDKNGSWQTIESHDTSLRYRADYVVGSGTHAYGFITVLDGHLFQSPVAWYRNRDAYGLAPGFENIRDPDFTRPVTADCLFCHAGAFNPIAGTENQYASVPFSHLSIGCSRCHGPTASHLENPDASNIVNPAELAPAARDSICEQCHLKGVARVPNPGLRITDFVPGQPLEQTFTVYREQPPPGTQPSFRVISQAEQLALSLCKRASGNRVWCGTCHDPHVTPPDRVAWFRSRCLQCHAGTRFPASHPARSSNCIACHMPQKEAQDGGHTVFTDHRIQRRPDYSEDSPSGDITPWREPPPQFARRNLGIALIENGMERGVPARMVQGYRMLAEVQQEFPQDSDMYAALGNVLLIGRQYDEAAQAFALAVRYDPHSSSKEASLGAALASGGERSLAEQHLEKALQLDPLNLSAASLLLNVYRDTGENDKADQLARRFNSVLQTPAAHP